MQEELITSVHWLHSEDEASSSDDGGRRLTDEYALWQAADGHSQYRPQADPDAVEPAPPIAVQQAAEQQADAGAAQPCQQQDASSQQAADSVSDAFEAGSAALQAQEDAFEATEDASEADESTDDSTADTQTADMPYSDNPSSTHSSAQDGMQSAPERFRAPELINTASSADGPQPRTSSLDVDPDGSSSSSAQEDSSSDDAADAFRQALQASDWGHHASESGGGRHAADEPASPHDSSDWDSESADVSASSSSAGTDEATDAPNADTDADAASAQEVDHNSVSGSGSAAEREARAQTASRPYPPSIAAMAVSDSDGTAGASADSSSGDDVSATAKAPLPLPLSRVEVQRQMAAKELVEPSLFLQALRATLDSKESAHPALQRHARQGCSHRARTRHALVFVAAEAAPYSKTGGLGDVVASLPCALAARGHRVMVITPRYIVDERTESLAAQLHDCDAWTRFELAGGEQWVNYHHEHRSGVDWVYVQHDVYERRGGLYGGDQGIYEDNQFRCAICAKRTSSMYFTWFAFFSGGGCCTCCSSQTAICHACGVVA